MNYLNKTVVITGGSSGIGLETAKLFAQKGAKVVFTGRNPEKIAAALRELDLYSENCEGLEVAVESSSEMESFMQYIKQKHHTIDVLFANAGVNGRWSPIEDLPVEEWEKTYNINIKGSFLTLKYAIPLMKENGGSVIFNGSINGTRSFSNRGATAYASTKAAQMTFAKMAALELAQHKIRVNIVCPGATKTSIGHSTSEIGLDKITKWIDYPNSDIPLTNGVFGKAQEVASVVEFLSSEHASFITGTEIYVDGGMSLIL